MSGEKIFIILGNGFSINLINELEKTSDIDLSNLFRLGDCVNYPDDDKSCFLSRKNCENLWFLGARTTLSNEDANKFIGDIITCLNVYTMSRKFHEKSGKYLTGDETVYIKAYNELTTYLRNLFIYYNRKVKDEDLNKILEKNYLIKFIEKCIRDNKELIIVSYNYDIFLERLLLLRKIDFSIQGFDEKDTNIKLIKPHGSISFVSKIESEPDTRLNIKDIIASNSEPLDKLKIEYNLDDDKTLINALIPPAGDATRTNGWPQKIREILVEKLESLTEKDKIIIYGISYNHVDRNEIDDILTKIDSNATAIYINPFPSVTFDAVLSSIFKNYLHYKNESILGE